MAMPGVRKKAGVIISDFNNNFKSINKQSNFNDIKRVTIDFKQYHCYKNEIMN